MLGNQFSSDSSVIEQFNVSRETIAKFQVYQQLLIKWQKKTNLVAPSTLADFWVRHVADSLQCRRIMPDAQHWVDIGSGGGFPGLIIAAELINIKGSSIKLVESNSKKCAFLREVARHAEIVVEIENKRIEDFVNDGNAPEIVTARALAKLGHLLEYCEPWLAGKTVGLFHKGREYSQEIEDCRVNWNFDLVEHPSKLAEESTILEISNLKKR